MGLIFSYILDTIELHQELNTIDVSNANYNEQYTIILNKYIDNKNDEI